MNDISAMNNTSPMKEYIASEIYVNDMTHCNERYLCNEQYLTNEGIYNQWNLRQWYDTWSNYFKEVTIRTPQLHSRFNRY